MQHAICLLSVVPVRKEPSHRSEMVTQLLFGEYVILGEEKDDFVVVTCLYDGYEGWVQAVQLTPVQPGEVLTTTDYIGDYAEEVLINGRCRMMPFGVPIYWPEGAAKTLQFGNREVHYSVLQNAVWKSSEKELNRLWLDALTWTFLDTPYLWGGKSIFGIDCSGFSQQVFKLLGIQLPRDAYQQAEQGRAVENLADAQCGDLAFFQNENGRVTHVGILRDKNEIVHASGKVRIDPVDEQGITSSDTGKRTHQLHSIRRFS